MGINREPFKITAPRSSPVLIVADEIARRTLYPACRIQRNRPVAVRSSPLPGSLSTLHLRYLQI